LWDAGSGRRGAQGGRPPGDRLPEGCFPLLRPSYNNQWMVVDYKAFTPGSARPPPGVLTVLEQIP